MVVYTFEDGILFKLSINTHNRETENVNNVKDIHLYYVLPTYPGKVNRVKIYTFKSSWFKTKERTIKELLKEIQKTKDHIKEKAIKDREVLDDIDKIEKDYIEANQEYHINRKSFINKINQWKNLNKVLDDDKEL